jgi:hypothetical protein
VTPQQIADVLSRAPRLPDGSDATAPRASGTLKAHYAPRTPLALLPFDALEPLLAAARGGRRTRRARRPRVACGALGAGGRRALHRRARRSAHMRAICTGCCARSIARRSHAFSSRSCETVEWIVNDRLGRAAAAFDAGDAADAARLAGRFDAHCNEKRLTGDSPVRRFVSACRERVTCRRRTCDLLLDVLREQRMQARRRVHGIGEHVGPGPRSGTV